MTVEIDRTSILSFQKCPRDRYYSRHFNGTGIEKIRKSLPLVFGSAFHAGAEDLLRSDIEGAVAKSRLYLELAFSVESVDLEEKQTEYAINEQKAIAEGLLRGWWAHDGERFLRDFEVLEVEAEGRAELADGMTLMFRPDALIRERISGDLYIVSWKTASVFGQFTVNQISSDMQSMSEVWGVEQQAADRIVAKYGPSPMGHPATVSLRIEGVLYLFAVKGQRRMDDYLGFKVQSTPLAYGWMRPGPTEDEMEWAWQYQWLDEAEINIKTGKPVMHKLGKGWRRVPIWESYPGGVKEWISDLAAQRISPRHINALEGVFPQSMPISRRADEIESWKIQIIGQETRIRGSVEMLESVGDWSEVEKRLDQTFPQHTARCLDYQSRCQFWEACWTPAVKADPLASGLYQIRVANHPEKGGEE